MKKHEWESLGFFTYVCSVCGDFDCVCINKNEAYERVKSEQDIVNIEKNRIQNRTDCDEMFAKKAADRLLGKPTWSENRRVTRL